MDDFEKRTLRSRRKEFGQNVTINADLLAALKRSGAISENDMTAILERNSNQEKVDKLFTSLLSSHASNAFESTCNALTLDYSWLAKELQTEVTADKGKLELDDDVRKEAAMLVHRKFGTSTRLSETDKKEMVELLAIKLQLSKEEWKHELGRVREELASSQEAVKARDKGLRTLDKSLLDFINLHDSQLVVGAHGMKSTSDILRTCVADDDLTGILKSRLAYLMDRVHHVLHERDLFSTERDKCYSMLKVKDRSIPLDRLFAEKLTEAPKQVVDVKAELQQRDETIKRLRGFLKEQADSEENESKVKELEIALEEAREKCEKLKLEMKLYKDDLENATTSGGNRLQNSRKTQPKKKT